MKIKDKCVAAKTYVLKHKKASIGIIAGASIVLLIVLVLCLCNCSGNNEAAGNITDQDSIGDITFALGFNKDGNQEEATSDNSEENVSDGEVSNEQTNSNNAPQEGQQAQQSPETASETPKSSAGNTTTDNGSDSSQSTPPAAQEPAKKWVVDYKKVWVEDSAAWTESLPIYGREEISVCNICGATITGNESVHGKAHMLAGEGSGHHTETTKVITGYDSVYHEATGHYETVENGGHWE